MRRSLAFFVVLAACKPPPPAPEGLDASTAYMFQNFYAAEPEYQAGLQGFMAWFNEEGYTLVGQEATTDNTDAFVVNDLTMDVIGYLPMAEALAANPERSATEPRDLSRAKGVVSLAEMDCTLYKTERLIARPDQNVIFSNEFEGYSRTFHTDREVWHEAGVDHDFDDISAPLDPFTDGFDETAWQRSLLRTDSLVDPDAVLTADVGEYPMHLDLRHGDYELDGETVSAFAVLSWIEDAAWGSAGNNALMQSYSLEVDIARPDEKTLRMLALWTEPRGSGIDPTSAFALNYAVNKSQKSSERMSGICAGEIEVPAEP
jgi:hypothetical protein